MKKLSAILGLGIFVALLVICSPNFALAEGCDCYIIDYDELWVDPNNPGSGDHAVVWFQCNQTNSTPYITTSIPWNGYEREWQVWDNGNNVYQVFVNGYYYWPLRAWPISMEEWQVFYTVSLE